MKSIRTKIILLSCLICVFSILSATVISYKIFSDNIKEQTYQKFEQIAEKNAAEIKGWFSVQERILNELYDEIIYRNDFNQENLIEYFNYKNQKNPDIKEYYIAFPNNVFVTGFGIWIPEGNYNAVEREWYKKAVGSDKIEISSPYVDANNGEVIVTLSKAIRRDGEVIGVLCSDIAINHIVNIINDSKPLEYGYSFLVDNNGYVLAHPNSEFLYSKEKGLTSLEQIYNNDITVKQLENRELKSIYDYDGEEKFLVYTDLGFSGWDIGLVAPVKEVMKPLNRIIDGSVALCLILTFISIILTFIFGNTISKPIKTATNYIEQMAQLDITEDIDLRYLKMRDEIGRMFISFQLIVNSLREFLIELNNISNKISTFSDKLAALSYKSSIDADNMAENSANMAELYDAKIKRISKLITSMETIENKTNKIIEDREKNITGHEILIEQFLVIAKEIESLNKELCQVRDLQNFESAQIKNTYSLIEKQTVIMEEISSASQCLAELGEELNLYISKFKS